MSGVRINENQKEWLMNNAKLYSTYLDITNAFNEYFKVDYDKLKIERFCQHNKIQKNMDTYHIYSAEENKWLLENRNNYKSVQEFVNGFNKKFNANLTKRQIENALHKRKIVSDNCVKHNEYTEEFKEWLKENYNNYTYQELIIMAEKKFNLTFASEKTLNNYATKYMKILKQTNTHFFSNERLSKPIGYEKVIKNAVYIKVKNDIHFDGTKKPSYRKNYRRKANVEYEKHYNVKLDDKIHYVVCIDRNIHNFAKENLMLLNKEEFQSYTAKKMHYEFSNNNLNKLLLDVVKLEHIIKKERKENEK